ncbi:hypothetical protein NKG05_26435 [Oerskovia sp. M15]
MVAALAGAATGALTQGGASLGAVTETDAALVQAARESLGGVELVGAVESDLPLLGLHGASGALAEASPALALLAQELERAHGHFAHEVSRAVSQAPAGAGHRSLLLGPTAPLPGRSACPGCGAGASARGRPGP